MASEELQGSDLLNQAQPPAPASTTLPPYPEMILTAIIELNESSGSNKSRISKRIEDTYGPLPPVHSTLLTHHLNRMKSAGHLLFSKNNYLIPDPNSPPRRGRGRPPKPKTALPASVSLSPRPRGRPPKSRDPTAPADSPKPKAAPSLSGKKRGRPPKVVPTTGLPDVSSTQPESLGLTQPESPTPKVISPAASPSGKKRGRPPKAAATTGAPIPTQPSAASGAVVSRGRGRPPKVKPTPTVPVGA